MLGHGVVAAMRGVVIVEDAVGRTGSGKISVLGGGEIGVKSPVVHTLAIATLVNAGVPMGIPATTRPSRTRIGGSQELEGGEDSVTNRALRAFCLIASGESKQKFRGSAPFSTVVLFQKIRDNSCLIASGESKQKFRGSAPFSKHNDTPVRVPLQLENS